MATTTAIASLVGAGVAAVGTYFGYKQGEKADKIAQGQLDIAEKQQQIAREQLELQKQVMLTALKARFQVTSKK